MKFKEHYTNAKYVMLHAYHSKSYILVKVPCECITANIARGCGREPSTSAIFAVMHERERYFNWFIVAEFLASAALNDSKWALRSKLAAHHDARKEPWQDR